MSRADRLPPPDKHDVFADLGPFYFQDEDLPNLKFLSSLVRPLPPEEIERLGQVYREAAVLTPGMIAAMLEGLG